MLYILHHFVEYLSIIYTIFFGEDDIQNLGELSNL